ncbi:MAG: hypothetical protein ABSF56_00680 [Minisyncoccia bacterium]|jgi:hypothetical protein
MWFSERQRIRLEFNRTSWIIVGFIASLALVTILDGFVLSVLWGWFVVPVFHLPVLKIIPAMGISMIVGYLTMHSGSYNEEVERGWGYMLYLSLGTSLLYALLALSFGWVLHYLM